MALIDDRPAKRAKLSFIDTIKVIVGQDRVEFVVHKDIVTKRSIFFRNDISHNLRGAETTKVYLLDTSPTTFEAYLQWAYSGKVVEFKSENEEEVNLDETGKLHGLVELYVLARQLKDVRLKVCLADMIEKRFDRHGILPSTQTITLINDQLPSESKLRLLFLDKCGGRTHGACQRPQGCAYPQWLLKEWDKLPLDFVKDLVKMRMENTCGSDVRERDGPLIGCEYHEHNKEMPRCPLKPPSHPDCYSCRHLRD